MKIGLTQRVLLLSDRSGITCDATDHGWYTASFLKGHELIPIPNKKDLDYDELAEELDLLIITGGDNTDVRVITETEIATSMVTLGKPVLGVCHGAFMLTSILGGEVVDGEDDRHMFSEHAVTYNGTQRVVNSSHNVLIQNKPPASTVLVTDPEGFVESWIKDNICAIVWHPERQETPWIPEEILEATGL